MNPCIYCGRPADGREHWFPRWLGAIKDVDVLLDRLCGSCNQALGRSLDQSMARESAEAVNRYVQEIAGRDDSRTNVFYYKSQRAEPPVVATAEGQGYEMVPLMEDLPGADPPVRRPLRQVVIRDEQGASHPIAVPDGIEAEWLRRAIEARALAAGRVTHVFCEPEDLNVPEADYQLPRWIRHALMSALPSINEQAKHWDIEVHWLTAEHVRRDDLKCQIRIALPAEYPRAVAKIAFHYLLKMDPYLSGHEVTFQPLRDYILRGNGNQEDFVSLQGRPFVGEKPEGRLRGVHHFFFLECDRDQMITARLQFFVRGQYQGTPMAVRLGTDPFVRHLRTGHAIRLYDEPTGGFDGEMVDAPPVQIDGLWGVLPPPWMIV